jgi:hypothetical protein
MAVFPEAETSGVVFQQQGNSDPQFVQEGFPDIEPKETLILMDALDKRNTARILEGAWHGNTYPPGTVRGQHIHTGADGRGPSPDHVGSGATGVDPVSAKRFFQDSAVLYPCRGNMRASYIHTDDPIPVHMFVHIWI